MKFKIPRERFADVLELARRFDKLYAQANGAPPRPLSPQSEATAQNGTRWAGNVREVENTIDRAVLMRAGTRSTKRHSLAGWRAARPAQALARAALAAEAVTRSLVGRTVVGVARP